MASSEKRDFDTASKTWDENPGRLKVAKCVTDAILAEIPVSAEMDAVDFGCGTGLVTLGLQPYVKSITGIDTSTGMLEVLDAKVQDRGLTNVRTMALDLEVDAATQLNADLLVSSMTMHHVPDVGRMLKAFHAMLADGGYLAITDLDTDDGEFHEDHTGVFHNGFERADFMRWVREAGFDDVQSTTACIVPKPVAGKGFREFSIFLITARKCAG